MHVLRMVAVVAASALSHGTAHTRFHVSFAHTKTSSTFEVSGRLPSAAVPQALELVLSSHGRVSTVQLRVARRRDFVGRLPELAANKIGLTTSTTSVPTSLHAEVVAPARPADSRPTAAAAGSATGSSEETFPEPQQGDSATSTSQAPGVSAAPNVQELQNPPSGAGRSKLPWAPPALTNPQTIQVTNNEDPDHISLNTTKDYILELPSAGLHGTLEIDGGHNIVLIGGAITVPASANQTDNGEDNTDTGIYIKGSTGTVHIEGVSITGDPDTQFDGIDVNAPLATVQLENLRVTNVWGSDSTEHADVVQTWGGVGSLKIDDLTAIGDYQGLTIDPDLGPVGAVDLRNIDLTYVAPPVALAPITQGGGYMMWLTHSTTSCAAPASVTLANVYVDDQHTTRVPTTNTVWPAATTSSLPCAGHVSGQVETWPDLPVSGGVTLTAPPNGPFVPAAVAGLAYTSPGYAAAS
jgi:hypothetical protein